MQERQARRAATHDVVEESNDAEPNPDSVSDSENNQGEIDNNIVQETENCKSAAQERRLRALKNMITVEIDSWLHYTKWY